MATARQLFATAELTNPVLGAAIMLAAVTGCRRGELCGLRWGDVDAERLVLHVRRAVKQAATGNGVVVGPTKTHRERRVSVDDVTLAVLATHRARVEGWAADAGVVLDPDGYLLTLDPTGATPMSPNV
ncbi:MAG TPA: tyrosine-type recombinase/integrase, partial [Acidimicrobiales bacterium]|nr:tyrosine-type recombinase/integrase [Acidimicrobiales bacterium]